MGIDAIMGFLESVPLGWLVIAGLTLLVAVQVLYAGARQVCTAVLALPAAAFVFSALSSTAFIGPTIAQLSSTTGQALLFGAIFTIAYVLIGRMELAYGVDSGQPVSAALAGVAFTAIVLVFWVGTPALQSIWQFGDQIQSLFGESYRLWWFLGGYAALGFVRS